MTYAPPSRASWVAIEPTTPAAPSTGGGEVARYIGRHGTDRVPNRAENNQFDAMLKAARERSVESVRPNHGIPIEVESGTFIVPVTINGQITLKFMIDSGATDVAVPADVVLTLIRTGSIAKEDFLGEQQ